MVAAGPIDRKTVIDDGSASTTTEFIWSGHSEFRVKSISDETPAGDSNVQLDAGELEDSQVIRDPNAIERPKEPSRQEVLRHRLFHLPYRSWCEVCVKSKGKPKPARSRVEDPASLKLMQIDFSFWVDGQSFVILSLRDVSSGFSIASAVENKSVSNHNVAELIRMIIEVGRYEAVLQSDQENSIMSLCQKAVTHFKNLKYRVSP